MLQVVNNRRRASFFLWRWTIWIIFSDWSIWFFRLLEKIFDLINLYKKLFLTKIKLIWCHLKPNAIKFNKVVWLSYAREMGSRIGSTVKQIWNVSGRVHYQISLVFYKHTSLLHGPTAFYCCSSPPCKSITSKLTELMP